MQPWWRLWPFRHGGTTTFRYPICAGKGLPGGFKGRGNLTTISLCLVSSYFLIVFLIFPSCFLMDTFHEAMFHSEFCSPTNRSKTISTCRKPQGQPNCGVPNGCADWRSELGQLAIDMLRISMCHLKVGECSNTFHWAKMIPNLWSPVRKFRRHSYASRDNWWWLRLTRSNQ